MEEVSGERLTVRSELDAGRARRAARAMARTLGFGPADGESVAIAVSELAMNLARYARGGWITLRPVLEDGRRGLRVESGDSGPGIANTHAAMQDGFTTGGGLGAGLGGVRRLMDEFEIASSPHGTSVRAVKWLGLARR